MKEPLLLIGKSSPRGGSEFPLSLSECILIKSKIKLDSYYSLLVLLLLLFIIN